MPVSRELYEFLKRWRDDAQSENPSLEVMHHGLCALADEDHCVSLQTLTELEFSFGGERFPFNQHLGSYFKETVSGKAHLNPKRLAWVEEQIREYENG